MRRLPVVYRTVPVPALTHGVPACDWLAGPLGRRPTLTEPEAVFIR